MRTKKQRQQRARELRQERLEANRVRHAKQKDKLFQLVWALKEQPRQHHYYIRVIGECLSYLGEALISAGPTDTSSGRSGHTREYIIRAVAMASKCLVSMNQDEQHTVGLIERNEVDFTTFEVTDAKRQGG